MVEQYVLEYPGFSASRGRCHVIIDKAQAQVLVGDPRDNPGTSVTNAIEQVALELRRWFDVDVQQGKLYQYVPWEPMRRHEWTAEVEFRADAWSMPVWTDADVDLPFVSHALNAVRGIQPYTLSGMTGLPLVNGLRRVRIEASSAPDDVEAIRKAGTVAHISQRRYYYVDVTASNDDEALETARAAVAPTIAPENVTITTPNAPIDQPGSLPV